MARSNRRPACITAAALLLACTQAFAINEMFAKDAPITRMTAEDFEIAGAALRNALDKGRDGESFEWKNAGTAASGTITLVDSFERKGMKCRGASFVITARGETSKTGWNLCRTAGGWKVAEGR
jgi:surface antigen